MLHAFSTVNLLLPTPYACFSASCIEMRCRKKAEQTGELIPQAHCKYQGFGSKKMRIRLRILLNTVGEGLPACPGRDSLQTQVGGESLIIKKKCS